MVGFLWNTSVHTIFTFSLLITFLKIEYNFEKVNKHGLTQLKHGHENQ